MRKTIILAVILLLVQISLIALTLLQEITWGGPDAELGSDVEVAADGSVYITGETRSFGAGGGDAFLLKFGSNGTLAWQRTYGTAPDAFLIETNGATGTPAAVVGTANGVVGTPNGSLTFAGETDTALIRVQR